MKTIVNNFELGHPDFLWLLLLLPILVVWYVYTHNKRTPTLNVSTVAGFQKGLSLLPKLKPVVSIFRLLALAALIIALARPRSVSVNIKKSTTRGIDIFMAIDVSASMLAKDLKPDRLQAL